ncbi:MAG: hypothetical protein KAS02_03005 [Candidatus Pacebacteria bacterium]|nr:hypothetical protein [Candidatus Paceibacterota bacterium]
MEDELRKLGDADYVEPPVIAKLYWETLTEKEKLSLKFEGYKRLYEMARGDKDLRKELWNFANRKPESFSDFHWLWKYAPRDTILKDFKVENAWKLLVQQTKILLGK